MNLNTTTSSPAQPANLEQPLEQRLARLLAAWLPYVHVVVPTALMLILGFFFMSSSYGTQDDDGYIFYQYARNLADGYGLSFNAGEVSYGVTSGAWIGLLSLAHWLLHGDIIIEAQLLGLALCALSAGLWAWAVARWTGNRVLGLIGGMIYALELDPVKASLSGLETGLNLAAFAAVAALLAALKIERPVLLGAVFGLAVLTRPDNLVLLLPVLGVAIASKVTWRKTLRDFALFGVATLIAIVPWYGWLWLSTGSPIPPTQTGKLLVFLPISLNITLGDYQALGPVGRFSFGLDVLGDFVGGAGPVRVAVLGWACVALLSLILRTIRVTRRYATWPALLAGGLLLQALVYAWSFPLLKLRYLINLLPVGLVLVPAALGVLWLHFRLNRRALSLLFALPRPVGVLAAAAALLLLVLGTVVYGRETGRQVANYHYYVGVQDARREVGIWLSENTPPNSLVALEPIGGVAFYSQRKILDLGGLIDKGVWSALASGYGDGKALAALLIARHADYLVEYTYPQGIGGAGNALALMPGARKVAVIESSQPDKGTRDQYTSYTIYSLGTR